MKCLVVSECEDWLKNNGYQKDKLAQSMNKRSLRIPTPKISRIQQNISREFFSCLDSFDEGLVWFTGWPFYKSDEMALINIIRKAHGENRAMPYAPGQVYSEEEKDELIGLFFLMLTFGWDCHFFFLSKSVHLFISHEDFFRIEASSEQIEKFSREFNDLLNK